MPEQYYPISNDYPDLNFAVLEALKYHICTKLYPDEDFATESSNRYLLANFEAGTEVAIRAAIQQFESNQQNMPFTVYSLGEEVQSSERQTHRQKTKKFFSTFLNAYVQSFPVEFDVPMISFFATGFDYNRARTILYDLQGKLDRLYVPITINGVLTAFSADLTYEINKGSYAFEFEEFLQVGNIYDLQHNVNIFYHHLVLDAVIAEVDDIEVSLYKLINENESFLLKTFPIPSIPTINNTDPSDTTSNVGIGSNITINFDVPMDENTFLDALGMSPWISADIEWSADSKQVIINPAENLIFDTTYEISLAKSLKSVDNVPLEEDFDFSFTTVPN
jgi:hypothetical protein